MIFSKRSQWKYRIFWFSFMVFPLLCNYTIIGHETWKKSKIVIAHCDIWIKTINQSIISIVISIEIKEKNIMIKCRLGRLKVIVCPILLTFSSKEKRCILLSGSGRNICVPLREHYSSSFIFVSVFVFLLCNFPRGFEITRENFYCT